MIPNSDAIALIELTSIARGLRVLDAMVKCAPVTVVQAGTTHPGKYTILVRGAVEEVALALEAGHREAAETLIDVVDLPNPDASLLKGLAGQFASPTDALLVIETYGVASAIRGVDAALKSADVALCALGLARDLGGKGYFTLCGELDAVEAAALAGRDAVTPGLLVGVEIIARPHNDTHLGLR